MQKKKSGVKKCLEILPLRGGGGPNGKCHLKFPFWFFDSFPYSKSNIVYVSCIVYRVSCIVYVIPTFGMYIFMALDIVDIIAPYCIKVEIYDQYIFYIAIKRSYLQLYFS